MPIGSKNEFDACAIGLDVGGTKIAGGLVKRSNGRVLVKRVIPTLPERGRVVVLADIMALAQDLITKAGQIGLSVQGIGLGLAELVDLEGNVTSEHTFAWRGVPVRVTLAQLAPAIVESDVRAAALAEAKFGAGQAYRLFVYVTVGTGISCCLVQDGRPYAGARGNALSFASSPLTTTCTTCGTVLKPIPEEIASGPGLVAGYNRQLAAALESGSQPESPTVKPVLSGEDVLAAVTAGDVIARKVVAQAGETLGTSVGWLVNVLDPEAIIVGGGLGLAGGLYWERFVASTREHIWSGTHRDLPISPAALGTDAGLIGAAATIWARQPVAEGED